MNPDLPPKLEDIIHKALEKDRNLRYQHASDMRTDLQRLKRDTETGRVGVAPSSGWMPAAQETGSQTVAQQPVPTSGSSRAVPASASSTAVKVAEVPPVAGGKKLWKILVLAGAVVVAALIAVGLYLRSRSAKPLTEKDTIVLADFDNTTGDAVFDGALKQALAVQLGQSPFLNILSDRKVGETLRLMGRQPNDRITHGAVFPMCGSTTRSQTEAMGIALPAVPKLGRWCLLSGLFRLSP